MPNDYLKKQPTKNERMFYEMVTQLDRLDHRLFTTSSFVSAIALLLEIEPAKIARLLTTEREKVVEYSKKINEEIDSIEASEHKEHSHEHPSAEAGQSEGSDSSVGASDASPAGPANSEGSSQK